MEKETRVINQSGLKQAALQYPRIMDEHLYFFVDYDGVIKTFTEGFPVYHNRDKAPFNHSMLRILAYIAWEAGRRAYFIPISSSPGSYTKEELKKMFVEVYEIDNLDLHPEEPIQSVRTDRHLYVKNCIRKYDIKYYIILDDEFMWYQDQNLNYFRTDTYNGITHDVFCSLAEYANKIKLITK